MLILSVIVTYLVLIALVVNVKADADKLYKELTEV